MSDAEIIQTGRHRDWMPFASPKPLDNLKNNDTWPDKNRACQEIGTQSFNHAVSKKFLPFRHLPHLPTWIAKAIIMHECIIATVSFQDGSFYVQRINGGPLLRPVAGRSCVHP